MRESYFWTTARSGQVGFTFTHTALCPDLLRLSQIGEADNFRGRVVRAFFRLLDVVLPVPQS
jgi:hypothetical protein